MYCQVLFKLLLLLWTAGQRTQTEGRDIKLELLKFQDVCKDGKFPDLRTITVGEWIHLHPEPVEAMREKYAKLGINLDTKVSHQQHFYLIFLISCIVES